MLSTADISIAGTMPAGAGPDGIAAALVGVAVTDGAVQWDGGAGTMAIAAFTANVASIAIFGAAGVRDRHLAVRLVAVVLSPGHGPGLAAFQAQALPALPMSAAAADLSRVPPERRSFFGRPVLPPSLSTAHLLYIG